MVGSAIAKGRIDAMDTAAAKAAPGVLAVVTTLDMPRLDKGPMNTAFLFGGPEIQHYHQAIAVVVAETFEQARDAAALIRVDYAREPGRFDLAAEAAERAAGRRRQRRGQRAPPEDRVGDFEAAFAAAPVKLDETYTTPDESHAMMEPHASIAAWEGDEAHALDLQPDDRLGQARRRQDARHPGGERPAGLALRRRRLRRQAVPARRRRARRRSARGRRGRPVKVALTRPLVANNTTHRPATIQRVRIGAGRDGKITAIAHESTSGDLPDGRAARRRCRRPSCSTPARTG